jgi:hypothetical protein
MSVERARFADALRLRPRGWAARGEAPPPALADHAWGAIGARLADSLATRAAVRAIARVPGATVDVAPRASS